MNKLKADEILHNYNIRSQRRWRSEVNYIRLAIDMTEMYAESHGGHPSLAARQRQLEELTAVGSYMGWTEEPLKLHNQD